MHPCNGCRSGRKAAGEPRRGDPPVIEGEFPTGPELMLWRPGIDRTRLRRRALCAGPFFPRVVLGFMLIATGAVPGHVNWLVLAVGVLLLASSVLAVWIDYQCADYDHQHGPTKPCFFDRTRGKYYYHPSDFRDLPPSTVHSVNRIIIAVRDVHASPASAWLDPHDVREIHHVAWIALRALDRTCSLRILVNDPRYQAIPDDLAGAHACLTMVDDTIDGIVDHLDQVRFLVHAWEQNAGGFIWERARP